MQSSRFEFAPDLAPIARQSTPNTVNMVPTAPQLVGAHMVVVGVGGAGCNAVNRMISEDLPGVRFLAVNTDAQALRGNGAPEECKIQIGEKLTRGLGAGARPEVGRAAVQESLEDVLLKLQGADLVFIAAGMGGGTGTGAAPVIAREAKRLGILTIAVVNTPFPMEGNKRARQAEAGLLELTAEADTVIVVPNARIEEIVPPGTSFHDSLKVADEVLLRAVQAIATIVNTEGEINTDFADLTTTMAEGGKAILGFGSAEGDERAHRAAVSAVSHPLLGNTDLAGATRVLINVRGSGIGLREVSAAAEHVRSMVHPDAEVIFGFGGDSTGSDRMDVTVIATGFLGDAKQTPTGGAGSVSSEPASRGALHPGSLSDERVPSASSDRVSEDNEEGHEEHLSAPRAPSFWQRLRLLFAGRPRKAPAESTPRNLSDTPPAPAELPSFLRQAEDA